MVHELRHHLERERRRRLRLAADQARMSSVGTVSFDIILSQTSRDEDESRPESMCLNDDTPNDTELCDQERVLSHRTHPIHKLDSNGISADQVANYLFLSKLKEHPIHSMQNIQDCLFFFLLLFSGLIWLFRRQSWEQERIKEHRVQQRILNQFLDGGRLRSESNMSSSLDDTSHRSLKIHRRGRTNSQEFFLSPLLAKSSRIKSSVDAKSEMFRNMKWADESEQEELARILTHQQGSSSQFQSESAMKGKGRQSMKPQQPQLEMMTVHHGPSANEMLYNTWTPPPSWAEAARKIFPKDVESLRKTLRIDVHNQPITLTISSFVGDKVKKGKMTNPSPHSEDGLQKSSTKDTDLSMPISAFSVHPTPPMDGGILEVYLKNSSKSDWMEHTFQSCQAAAQFQSDLIAAQVLGPAIQNMYNVFRLIHEGSVAHEGQEFVLHSKKSDPQIDHLSENGICWDDVMRVFGSTFPKIRVQLEDMWWSDGNNSKKKSATPAVDGGRSAPGESTSGPSTESKRENINDVETQEKEKASGLVAQYINKRVLLGPVDFFRLFVPTMGADSFPYTSSDVQRMEQLLKWRKRVARASVLLQAYARTRQVVNIGWQLGCILPQGYWRFRLAYDMNIDNQLHDRTAKNEYYEPSVSRDVYCRVRGSRFLKRTRRSLRPRDSIMSLGQLFSLVGAHSFMLSTDKHDSRLAPTIDPVQAIPSLRTLITKTNPDLDFFVISYFTNVTKCATIFVFCRSTPVGVDPSFDNCWHRFKRGNLAYRRERLELSLQLAFTTLRFSLVYSLFLRIMSFFIWILDKSGFIAQTGNTVTERYTLPAFKVDDLGSSRHFGGSGNYVSCTVDADSREWNTMIARLILFMVSMGKLRREIVDFSLKIKGTKQDELPERVMCVTRQVQVNTFRNALPSQAINFTPENQIYAPITVSQAPDEGQSHLLKVIFYRLLWDPMIALFRLLFKKLFTRKVQDDEMGPSELDFHATSNHQVFASNGSKPSVIASSDPLEKAVNKLIEILEDVRVPLRSRDSPGVAGSVPWALSISADKALQAREDLQQVSVLRVLNRSDLKRYFVSSNCSLKKATVRAVESASWRGLTFPVDLRSCRVELQNGQFFQQGTDIAGHPVFYFRNMLKGPWRGDEDAVIASVVHRLEKCFAMIAKDDPEVKCTLIVLLGQPKKTKRLRRLNKDGADIPGKESDESRATTDDDEDEASLDETVDTRATDPMSMSDNPRVSSDEKYFTHTNDRVAQRLVQLVMLHYPERLYRCLVVKGYAGDHSPRTAIGGIMTLTSLVDSSNTRRKVKYLRKRKDLLKYVDKEELIELAGGEATIDNSAFEVE